MTEDVRYDEFTSHTIDTIHVSCTHIHVHALNRTARPSYTHYTACCGPASQQLSLRIHVHYNEINLIFLKHIHAYCMYIDYTTSTFLQSLQLYPPSSSFTLIQEFLFIPCSDLIPLVTKGSLSPVHSSFIYICLIELHILWVNLRVLRSITLPTYNNTISLLCNESSLILALSPA